MYIESFPSKLKSARLSAGYTQQEVADNLKIAQSNIAKYENGKLEPNIETLGLLADFYEVSLDWLIGTKGTKKI